MRHASMSESYPIGVEKRVRALQRAGQRSGIIEVERSNGNPISALIALVRMPGQSSDGSARLQQSLRDILSCVPECAGNDVFVGHVHSVSNGNSNGAAGHFNSERDVT